MQIVYSSLHNLDLNEENPLRKDIPSDFCPFMESYIQFATAANDTSREYTVRDYNRTVVNCISNLFSIIVLSQKEKSNHNLILDSLSDSIALKLLDSEKIAQEQVQGMSNIQKGSIVQALIKIDSSYKYIIAKVEHAEWFDGESLKKNLGFPSENKVWKSVVFSLFLKDESVFFESIQCYLNHPAKYWTETFLEIDEAKNDYNNTRAFMKAIDIVLSSIKDKSPIDYYKLRNAAAHKLQSEQVINIPDIATELFDNYRADDNNLNTKELKEKLLALQKDGKFDSQFNSDPDAIKLLKRVKITVSPSVDVFIREPHEKWEDDFLIHEKADGRKYLMLRCYDEKTLKKFPKDNQ